MDDCFVAFPDMDAEGSEAAAAIQPTFNDILQQAMRTNPIISLFL